MSIMYILFYFTLAFGQISIPVFKNYIGQPGRSRSLRDLSSSALANHHNVNAK